jgi:hypothetical protein
VTVLHVGENGRTYERRFDHEEAAHLYYSGQATQTELARRYGVSAHAISLALKRLNPKERAKDNERRRIWMREHRREPCRNGCGRLIWTTRKSRSGLCHPCSAMARATSAREAELCCSRCRAWKPDAAFPWANGKIARRSRHATCRACQAADRQERRVRASVPCKDCGRPRLNAKDSGASARGSNDTGLCLSCYRRSMRKVAA